MKRLEIIKNILTNRIYFCSVSFTILVAIALPILGQRLIFPAFYNQMIENVLQDSKEVGTYIKRAYLLNGDHFYFDKESIDALKKDFSLERIKIFDKDGVVILSTNIEDINEKNTHQYFYEQVAKNRQFYKIVNSGKTTLEDRVVQKDVAEVYVPMVQKSEFIGAVEVYYDITQRRENFYALMDKVFLSYSIFITIFLILFFIMMYSVSRMNLKTKAKEREIEELNNSLLIKVEERTKELKELNETLEKRVEEEISKNREKDIFLMEQSKLSSLNELLSNIAHQWRQPLSVISACTGSIKLKNELQLLEPDELNHNLDEILHITQKLSAIIENFRGYFISNGEKEEFLVDEIVDDLSHMMYENFKIHGIVLQKRVNSSFKLYGIKREFLQLLLNIINNARDIFILRDIDREDRYIFIDLDEGEKSFTLTIKDSAGGIQKESLNRVFEPYFTTKHQSQGTGLGLYTVREILKKEFRGEISVKNVEFEIDNKKINGAQFTITIAK